MKADQEIFVMQKALDFFNSLFVYDATKEEKRAMSLRMAQEVLELQEVFYPRPEERKVQHGG